MKKPTRKQRTVMMTDSDWQDLKETAAAAGMTVSAFIVHRLAGSAEDHGSDPRTDARLERIERSVRILEEIERLRLSADDETWEKVSAIVEARMEIDRKLD